jgi:hypothetical protein
VLLEPSEHAPPEPSPLRVIDCRRSVGLNQGSAHGRLGSHAMGSKAPVRASGTVRLAE